MGCERSGNVRRAFRARGHEAWSCDLVPADDAGPHYQEDVLEVAYREPWDMALFFPDCTYLTSAGLHWNKRGRQVNGLPRSILTEQAIDFVKQLWAAPIQRKALENPIGCLSTRWHKPTQIIQPYDFGDSASKATCLWLDGLMPLVLGPRCQGRMVEWPRGSGRMVERWDNQTDSGQNRLPPSKDRAKLRSETHPGIAAAFAGQWG